MLSKIRKRKANAEIKPQDTCLLQRAGRTSRGVGKWLPTTICTLIAAFALNIGVFAAHRTFLQRGIAEEVLRFHVLANSDSEEDQSVKLLVRDAVLEWIDAETDAGLDTLSSEDDSSEEERIRESAGSESTSETGGKEYELQFLTEHLADIEKVANQVLREQKQSYRAQVSVENCYFPERTYGNCTFPAGWYDALRIRLGEAKGHNWWCVLYPGLCFSDCLHAVVEDGELADLKELLTVEEYESLLRKPKKWKIAFRWF